MWTCARQSRYSSLQDRAQLFRIVLCVQTQGMNKSNRRDRAREGNQVSRLDSLRNVRLRLHLEAC